MTPLQPGEWVIAAALAVFMAVIGVAVLLDFRDDIRAERRRRRGRS